MLVNTIVLAVTVLIPLATSISTRFARCSGNSACPSGSECVENFCVSCSADYTRCMRSDDRCKKLNCTSDEGCYVSEQQNADATVTLKLVCAKNDPCATKTCQSAEHCQNVYTGYQPPSAECRPNTIVHPCDGKNCQSGTRCLVRAALCGFNPCISEGVCVNDKDCASCNDLYQYCDITGQGTDLKGSCLNFMRPLTIPFPMGNPTRSNNQEFISTSKVDQ